MARVPISFYLNILAGIIVLFNHYAASETGDVALNKVTGAADRFCTLFRDTALTLQHGCTPRLETALCGPAADSILPHDAVEYLRARYCHPPVKDAESVGGTSDDRRPHGGNGGSDFAFAHYQTPTRPPAPRTSTEGPLRRSPFSFDWSSQSRLSQAIWDRSSEAMATVGALLLRTCASWWWFRAPLKVTGFLLAAYSALSALGYMFGGSMAMRYVAQVCVASEPVNANGLLTRPDLQVYMVVAADFLQCIEWEAQRQVLDISVMMTERACGFVMYARRCT
jgi:hypothetical protein